MQAAGGEHGGRQRQHRRHEGMQPDARREPAHQAAENSDGRADEREGPARPRDICAFGDRGMNQRQPGAEG
jgi:hypothetical protein